MNVKRKKIHILIFLVIFSSAIIPIFPKIRKKVNLESDHQEQIYSSGQQTLTKQWIKNPNFTFPIDSVWSWENGTLGDNSDMDGTNSSGQADFRVLGDTKTFTVVSGLINSSSSPGWETFRNGDFLFPDHYEINASGAHTSHSWGDDPNQAPSIHWKTNISLQIDMSDYNITSASLEIFFNASVSTNIDTALDTVDNFAIGDFVTFYAQISNLDYESPVYTVAKNRTTNLGQDSSPEITNITDQELTYVSESDLITALNSAFEKDPDHSNFTLTLGIDIYSEDNEAPGADNDDFESLIIKTCNLTFTVEKKIDHSTTISWNQIGDKLDSDSTIINATFNFKVKTNNTWPSSAPLSEIKFYINNKSHSQGVFKLSSISNSFEYKNPNGFDVSSLISTNVDISTSIEVFLKDSFVLNETIMISITNITLNITYIDFFLNFSYLSYYLRIFKVFLIKYKNCCKTNNSSC